MTNDFETTVIAQLSEIRMEIARLNSRVDYLGDEVAGLLEKEAHRRAIGWTGVL